MIEHVAVSFEECVEVIHRMFPTSVAQDLWHDFAVEAKRLLLKGLPGDVKSTLALAPT